MIQKKLQFRGFGVDYYSGFKKLVLHSENTLDYFLVPMRCTCAERSRSMRMQS